MQRANSNTSSRNFRELIRKNSTKFGDAAESLVLPPNKRSIKRIHKNTNEEVDLGRANSAEALDPNKRSCPWLIPLIALVQIFIMVFSKKWIWLSLCYDPFRRHEIWRFISILFVHASYGHITFNVVSMVLLGLVLEVVHGWKRVGGIFLSGVIGGSLAITVLQPLTYAVGASAGVTGLWTAHLVTLLLNWGQMDRRRLRLICYLVYAGLQTAGAYFLAGSKVSQVGHIGGLIGGFLAAVFLLRNFEVLSWEKLFQKIVGVVGILLLLAVVIFNIGFPRYYFLSEFNFDYVKTYFDYIVHRGFTAIDAEELCKQDPKCLDEYAKALANLNTFHE